MVLSAGGTSICAAARLVHPFLAVNKPVGGQVLVVEGWMAPEALDEAAKVFREGGYGRLVTTGGPAPAWLTQFAYVSQATLARDYLVRQGVPADSPAAAQDRTFLSAVVVREHLAAAGRMPPRFGLVSVGVHSRRSWHLKAAFSPGVEIGIIALRPTTYEADAWWTTSEGAKTVLTEMLAWAWTVTLFRPPE